MLEEIEQHASLVGGAFANLIWFILSLTFLIKSGRETNTKAWLVITVVGFLFINWVWASLAGIRL